MIWKLRRYFIIF